MKKSSVYMLSVASGLLIGFLISPNSGTVNRLKWKRGINKLTNKAIGELETLEQKLT